MDNTAVDITGAIKIIPLWIVLVLLKNTAVDSTGAIKIIPLWIVLVLLK
jgi:hypothetical protein